MIAGRWSLCVHKHFLIRYLVSGARVAVSFPDRTCNVPKPIIKSKENRMKKVDNWQLTIDDWQLKPDDALYTKYLSKVKCNLRNIQKITALHFRNNMSSCCFTKRRSLYFGRDDRTFVYSLEFIKICTLISSPLLSSSHSSLPDCVVFLVVLAE